LSELALEDLRFHGRGPASLALADGECVALTGPSGAGKTLLLRAVADLDPHEGSARLDGAAADSLPAPEWRRRVGMLPAESAWWADVVGEHFPEPVDEERLVALGLPPEATRWQIARLSTGERQRLAILRLLANRPSALLLDEPTASLDAESVERVERLLERYRRETGAPALWVSHDPAQASRVASRRFLMKEGGVLVELRS